MPDMDLCCLIDSKERLAATDLVTMLGDLLERGESPIAYPFAQIAHVYRRNKVSRQASSSRTNTNREVIPRSISRSSSRNCLRYWLRKQISARKYATTHVLRHGRPNSCTDYGPFP
jgi:hypothetical protein